MAIFSIKDLLLVICSDKPDANFSRCVSISPYILFISLSKSCVLGLKLYSNLNVSVPADDAKVSISDFIFFNVSDTLAMTSPTPENTELKSIRFDIIFVNVVSIETVSPLIR